MRRFAFENPPTFKGHLGRISALAFSPDGSLLASAGEHDLTICIWRVSDGELLHRLLLSELSWFDWVTEIAFSPDGNVAYGVSDVGLQAFSVITGERIWHRKPRRSSHFQLSPTGHCAMVSDEVKGEVRLRLLDLNTNRFLRVRFPAGTSPSQFSPDGTLFRTCGWMTSSDEDAPDEVFVVATGERVLEIPNEGSKCILEIKGRNVLVCLIAESEASSHTELLDLSDGTRQVGPLPSSSSWWHLVGDKMAAVPGTTRLVFASMGRTCGVVDLEDADFRRTVASGPGYDNELAMSPDGARFALGDASGAIRLVETREWTVERLLAGGGRPLDSMVVSSDSRYLAVGTHDLHRPAYRFFLWDLERLEMLGPFLPARHRSIWRARDREGDLLHFDSDLSWVGRRGTDAYRRYEKAAEMIALLRSNPGRPILKGVGPFSNRWDFNACALSCNGRWLGLANETKAWLWDVEQESVVAEVGFPRVGQGFYSAALSEGGGRMIVGELDQRLYIDFGKGTATIRGDYDEPHSAAIHPDGSRTARGSAYMETFHVYDRRRRKNREMTGHVQSMRALAYTPDGRTLLSASADGQVILWDAETLERKATLMMLSPNDHVGPTWEWIAFTPGGECNGSPGAEQRFAQGGPPLSRAARF